MNQHPAYELFEELGRGVNTVVYRSYDLSLGREVAIKELDESGRRDPRHRERFLREAQFLAQFEHDNVLRVYSVDTERGWIIMELMKGTLASIIAAGPSDPDLVRSVLKQTLEALAFLHEKNKVHGTVRPTNLLINEAGRVKLSEFEQTDVGGELRAPTGSKKYLAPELIRREFGEFGPPLDLYCLGFTALEMLKGPQFESLFPGTGKGAIDADIAWLRWHSSPEELASTKKLVKGIPDDLAHVLDRMLKKRVADRAQTAQEVLKELADRPFIPVPVAGVTDDEGTSVDLGRNPAPAVVRTLATPQTVLPRGNSPAVSAGAPTTSGTRLQSIAKSGKESKSSGSVSTHGPPKYSKDWFNQQLGRPYILYPLCALILLGALWFSIHLNTSPLIPVTFDVQPDAANVKILVNNELVQATKDGVYSLKPGHYALTFNKDGFQPLTQEFDVSKEKNKFAVKLEPLIKLIDVTVQVTPVDSQLSVGGTSQKLFEGASTQKHQEGQPFQIEAKRDGFVTASRTISPEELTKLGNKVTLELEREKPLLPKSIVAKSGAEIDPETQLPVRVLATTLGDREPLELVLVKPGRYSFGSTNEKRLPNELSKRSIEVERPFYIAINETTNAQYQRFFEAVGEGQAGNRWQKAARKWAEAQSLDPVKNHLPATNMSTDQAQAFCQWLGGRLPTEIEWEAAVRGPQDRGYPFPWGTEKPGKELCKIFYGEKIGSGFGPLPVEQLQAGVSPLGLLNAIGNAAEWCQDSEKAGEFILRGCSFTTANIDDVRVTWRGRGDVKGEEDFGFRVVIPMAENAKNVPSTTTLKKSMPAMVVKGKRLPAKAEGDKATTVTVTNKSGVEGAASLLAPIWVLSSLPWQSYYEGIKPSL